MVKNRSQQITSNDGHIRYPNADTTRSKQIHQLDVDFEYFFVLNSEKKKTINIICWSNQVEPVQIWSSTQLIKIFEELGVNEKIGLSGRPVSNPNPHSFFFCISLMLPEM